MLYASDVVWAVLITIPVQGISIHPGDMLCLQKPRMLYLMYSMACFMRVSRYLLGIGLEYLDSGKLMILDL